MDVHSSHSFYKMSLADTTLKNIFEKCFFFFSFKEWMQESCYWPFLSFTLCILENIAYNTIKSLSTVHMMTFFYFTVIELNNSLWNQL